MPSVINLAKLANTDGGDRWWHSTDTISDQNGYWGYRQGENNHCKQGPNPGSELYTGTFLTLAIYKKWVELGLR